MSWGTVTSSVPPSSGVSRWPPFPLVARQTKLGDTLGRMRLSKLQVITRQKREARTEEVGEDRDNIQPMLTASQNFDYLADMVVASDIFEPVTDMDRRDNMMDINIEHFKQPTYSLSYRVMDMFPYTKACQARALLHRDPFNRVLAVAPDRLRQTAYSRKEMVKVDRLPNYIDILLS